MAEVTGEFTLTGMGGEDELGETPALRITHASGEQTFSGGIEGSGHVDWLLGYRADRTAALVGLQRIDGSLDGARGSLVLASVGSHDGTTSRGHWTIVGGSGTGDLRGISGDGDWSAGPGPKATFRLRYELH
jgi:hypothetical protein